MCGPKITCFLCGDRLTLCVGGRNILGFSASIEIDMVCVGDPNWLGFSVGMKLDLMSVWR